MTAHKTCTGLSQAQSQHREGKGTQAAIPNPEAAIPNPEAAIPNPEAIFS